MAAKRKAPKKAKVEGRGRMEAEHLTRAELTAPRKKRSDAGTEREITRMAKAAQRVADAVWQDTNFPMSISDDAEKVAVFLFSLKGQARPKKETSHPHTAGGARRNGGGR